MNVKISLSTSGKAVGRGMSHGMILKDVNSVEEVQEAFDKEFRGFFPVHGSLTEPEGKRASKKNKE